MTNDKLIKDSRDPHITLKSQASRIILPLLDALSWKGTDHALLDSMPSDFSSISFETLLDVMTRLNFQHTKIKTIDFKTVDKRLLPILITNDKNSYILINTDQDDGLVFDGKSNSYHSIPLAALKGSCYIFKFLDGQKDSLLHIQSNWFNKLLYRFKNSMVQLTMVSLLLTLLNLSIPLLVILVYEQISTTENLQALVTILLGVLIFIGSSSYLFFLRSRLTNYISVRMGNIISINTFRRLMYLSPNYTESASISSQVSRIKDFENLKRFVTSGLLINVIDLILSSIYIVAIFILGGWLGFIPIITLVISLSFGLIMRPLHKIKMEQVSQSKSEHQQNLLEILRNRDEIKAAGASKIWLKRHAELSSESIHSRFVLSDYVSLTNNISYFITNASVLILIYGGVIQVFENTITMGMLIGIIMLYWKITSSMRGAFSLIVQVNGILKSISQINRFMMLPQDTNLKTSMVPIRPVNGSIDLIDVSIKYNQASKPALINMNLSTQPGDIIGLTGHDGSGKTTVFKLIMGMYKPQAGRILIDHRNIKQLEPLSLRQSMSYSPENHTVFKGTLRDNLKLYNPKVNDIKLQELIKLTGLDLAIKKHHYTLDTYFDAQSIQSLCTQFKKLLNLTRLLTRNVKVYLIDEPESHLNLEDIRRLSRVFKQHANNNRATIIISTKHPEFLNICDRKIHLDQGKTLSNELIKEGDHHG